MLGFGLDQFSAGYKKAGDLQNAIDAMRWGADYLVNAHSAPNRFVAVMGNSTLDFNYYVRLPPAISSASALWRLSAGTSCKAVDEGPTNRACHWQSLPR